MAPNFRTMSPSSVELAPGLGRRLLSCHIAGPPWGPRKTKVASALAHEGRSNPTAPVAAELYGEGEVGLFERGVAPVALQLVEHLRDGRLQLVRGIVHKFEANRKVL